LVALDCAVFTMAYSWLMIGYASAPDPLISEIASPAGVLVKLESAASTAAAVAAAPSFARAIRTGLSRAARCPPPRMPR
jgi:hypothetical protein